MTASVREAGPFERVVGFEVSDAEIDAAKAGAARRLSKDLKLKGFRPGKAPRPVVEAAVGSARLRSEAIEDAIGPKLADVLRSEDIAPAVNPELEKMEDVDGGVSVEVKVTLWPKLDTVPAYRDRQVEIESPEVTDDEVEAQLERMREQFGQVEEVERPAADGDFVSLDISATVDGTELPEASATELLYRIGSEGLLDGADEALIGTTAGDVVTLDAPVPDGFGDQAGEDAVFSITVNEVKELVLPDLDDEWVDENTEYSTVDELETTLRERMADMKKSTLVRRFNDQAMETLVAQVDVEIPEAILTAEMDALLHRFLHRLEEQDVSIEDYFNATGMTRDQFLADLRNQADHSLRSRLLLDAVIEDAALEVTDSEVDALVHSAAEQSEDPLGFLKAFRGSSQELSLRSDMLRDKAVELILENATAVDPEGNEIDLDFADEPAAAPATGEIPTGEVVEGEVVEGEVLEGEVLEAEAVEDATDQENS